MKKKKQNKSIWNSLGRGFKVFIAGVATSITMIIPAWFIKWFAINKELLGIAGIFSIAWIFFYFVILGAYITWFWGWK